MDATLTDFEGSVKELGPEAARGLDDNADPEIKQKMYNAIEGSREKFWANMKWLPGSKQLWSWLSQFQPVLLSSPGLFSYARPGKIEWVKKNIPGTTLFLEPDKWRYAERCAILIDDSEENIIAWVNRGGIGVLFKNPTQVKDDLIAAIKKISPSRAENLVTMEVLQDIDTTLTRQAKGKKITTPFGKKYLNTSYQIPYLAGYSLDGETIYIDKRYNPLFKLKDGRQMDITKYLIIHEGAEKYLEDTFNYKYPYAHEKATGIEKKIVEADGYPWEEYQDYALSEVQRLKELDPSLGVPKDLDLKPEKDVHNYALLKKIRGLQ